MQLPVLLPKAANVAPDDAATEADAMLVGAEPKAAAKADVAGAGATAAKAGTDAAEAGAAAAEASAAPAEADIAANIVGSLGFRLIVGAGGRLVSGHI